MLLPREFWCCFKEIDPGTDRKSSEVRNLEAWTLPNLSSVAGQGPENLKHCLGSQHRRIRRECCGSPQESAVEAPSKTQTTAAGAAEKTANRSALLRNPIDLGNHHTSQS